MTGPRTLGGVTLPRPAPAPDRGRLDDAFYDLVEARFVRVVTEEPVFATYLGIHAWDDRLGDPSRDHVLGELDAERRHLAAVEALDPAGLSPGVRFERDLEIHNLRRVIFDTDVVRRWERRSSGIDALGDALFVLFARDFGTPAERYAAIAGRLEALPEHLIAHRTRASGPQVRSWQQLEVASAREMPAFLAEIVAAAEGFGFPAADLRRIRRAVRAAEAAIEEHARWVESTLAAGTDSWALGRERYDELVRLRAFDGLDADAILEIGREQLAKNHADREAAARDLDPDATTLEVVDRVKSDHPPTFDAALDEYRTAMARARRHLIDRDLVTIPPGERVEVVATPTYLRRVMPFAAYFSPAPFDPDPVGTYVVTPSVDDDPAAMREHYRAAISNTSIHEAYPGHHLQLAIAVRHPSLTRLFCEAPEFVEGWGMYSEQMMREESFDDGPAFRLALATDAIWRACRIVLDIRMHRGELSIEEATEYLVEQTRFERPNAAAEVRRYTSSPTYPLSYLLGKVLILGLRDGERRRLGSAFSLRDFHDTLLRNGSIPVSFHRRLLAGEPGITTRPTAGAGNADRAGANGTDRAAARH
ncbi:MAG TPA: DUF885 domain-containing protein [Candidatus Limnocylindrales bacterium]|nr:DUF885 domain-containing protein [Candidatus Limnocylindrales bacterium]